MAKKFHSQIGSVGDVKIFSNKRILTGDKELDKRLADLGNKKAKKVSSQALNRGLTVIAKEIGKVAVEELDLEGVSPAQIKKAIGKRFAKAKRGESKGLLEAKAGVHVGPAKKQKAREENGAAPWWLHFFALGTRDRFHRSGKYVGRIEKVDFVQQGMDRAQSSAVDKIREAVRTGIEREAKRP